MTSVRQASLPFATNPFLTGNPEAYQRWRDAKLASWPVNPDQLIVEVHDPRALSASEHAQLLGICRRTNMVIYASGSVIEDGKAASRELGRQFGLLHLDSNLLADEDAITPISVVAEKSGRGYIPYSNRRLLWHTDGYYNPPEKRVRAFVLHCDTPAAEGGENALLDPEIAYIHLREADPEYIRALMEPDAMTIPANEEADGVRAAQSGPVFSIDPATGSLHMRYTARTRSVIWKDDTSTRAAVQALEHLLNGDSRYVIRHRLGAGQGLLCNNVLHNRTAFTDAVDKGQKRLLYRARYHDRIAGTGLLDIIQ